MASQKPVAFELREKRIPSSSLEFTGIIQLPSDLDPDVIHHKIVKYFGGDKSAIRGLYSEEKVLEKLETLKKASMDNVLKKESMPQICWLKIDKQERFMREEVREVVREVSKSELCDRKAKSLSANSVENECDIEKIRLDNVSKDAFKNTAGQTGPGSVALKDDSVAVTEALDPVFKPLESVVLSLGTDISINAIASENEVSQSERILVYYFLDEKGRPGQKYTFDKEAKEKMKDMISQNLNPNVAEFFLEWGMRIVPILHEENLCQRDRIEMLQTKIDELQKSLYETELDRNIRATQLMNQGTTVVKEVSEARVKVAEEKARVEELRNQISVHEEANRTREQKSIDSISDKMEKLNISAEKIATDLDKIDVNTQKIIQIIGKDKDKSVLKMWTSTATKLANIESGWIIVSKVKFFKTVGLIRSLGRDIDKLVRGGNIFKMLVKGEGDVMAYDMLEKKSDYGSWSEKIVVFNIDDLELVKNKDKPAFHMANLKSVAEYVAQIIQDEKPKKLAVVAGPTNDKDIEEARAVILRKLGEFVPEALCIDMTEMAGKLGVETLGKWCCDGKITPYAVAYILSRLASWAEDTDARTGEIKELEEICRECYLFHKDAEKCYKKEFLDIKENIEANSDSNSGKRNISEVDPCSNCGNYHTAPCRYANSDNSRRGGRGGRSGQSSGFRGNKFQRK